jgi:transposase
MLTLTSAVRIYLAAGATDLRMGFDGLAGVARDVLARDPLSGALFVFANARRTRIRILTWDGTGLWLMTKRLEKGTFAWPEKGDASRCVSLRHEELAALVGRLHVRVVRRPGFERRAVQENP